MSIDKTNEALKKKYDQVLNNEELEPTKLASILTEIANTGGITSNYRSVLDVIFLRENLEVNRTMKKLTWIIAGLTVVNLILVAISLFN